MAALFSACGGSGGGGGDAGNAPSIPSTITPEQAYCSPSSIAAPASFVTITGTANYEYRQASASGLQGGTLPTAAVRFAEVRATDSNGTLVQCTETDNSGNFSIKLPDDSGTYTVSVMSRADNSTARVSVLDAPDVNNVYSISTSVVTDADKSVGTLTAEGRDSVIGGAFNILDQIVKASEYLKTQTAGCAGINGPHINCSAFDPQSTPSGGTSKVQAFWKKGFNPNSYFGASGSGLSFYIPSLDQLYILGGIDGDVDNSDTDHFDNSVILHEYGHFLEDQYAASDSPGGAHDGNSVLDPRLMWSEGWANFFQAAVLNDPLYQDTSGNADGSTGNFFFQNLEFRCNAAAYSNESGSCFDKATTAGEGNFREFAIARSLWDAIDDGTDNTNGDDTFTSGGNFTDDFQLPFSELWTAFLNLSNSGFAFRSVGLFHELVAQLTGTGIDATNRAAYQDLVSKGELHEPNRVDYANPMSLGGSCTTTISSSGSDLFKAHDYFDYTHPGGAFALDLTYTLAGGTSDVDIYLYNQSHVLFTQSTIAAVSNSENDGGTENISVTSLPAGRYLINVHYFAGPSNQTYALNLTNTSNPSGTKICPETSF